ncbi:MAG: hypothetical protein ACI4DP_05850 [Candidatus Ornithomonoglobus sp.]
MEISNKIKEEIIDSIYKIMYDFLTETNADFRKAVSEYEYKCNRFLNTVTTEEQKICASEIININKKRIRCTIACITIPESSVNALINEYDLLNKEIDIRKDIFSDTDNQEKAYDDMRNSLLGLLGICFKAVLPSSKIIIKEMQKIYY